MKKNIPKGEIFRVPEGYFESLPEQVMAKNAQGKQRTIWISWAAAAMVVLSTSLFIFKFETESITETTTPTALAVEDEIELLIDQGEWSAEDVLSLSDDPNAILNELVEEQWQSYQFSESELEEELWYY
ncbi:hypothetical protein DN752_20220 [Echinicola strongylocentroti]|uniref:Uncharacterized protein n=1 Tax=Echinicola strongylocentroti TaxID=1795355 RepID=A0A2Z4INE7_9BACT|nr:hypothetical protein [Echinicola strongylocentroti]AWW32277.1 hypothetical protein DN752_20220 [Echinicola strongylocentroti]